MAENPHTSPSRIGEQIKNAIQNGRPLAEKPPLQQNGFSARVCRLCRRFGMI
jgi:hypothetical protein